MQQCFLRCAVYFPKQICEKKSTGWAIMGGKNELCVNEMFLGRNLTAAVFSSPLITLFYWPAFTFDDVTLWRHLASETFLSVIM